MNPDPPPFSSTPLQAMSRGGGRGRVWERMECSGYEEGRWAAVFFWLETRMVEMAPEGEGKKGEEGWKTANRSRRREHRWMAAVPQGDPGKGGGRRVGGCGDAWG